MCSMGLNKFQYFKRYSFRIGSFKGGIYLPVDTTFEGVVNEIIDSLRTDLEDRKILLKENDSILVNNGIKTVVFNIKKWDFPLR